MPEDEIVQHVMDRINAAEADRNVSATDACPHCGRGGVQLQVPTMSDADALIVIRDHFDMYRRNFTPEMQQRMDSMNKVIFYLSAMNSNAAGTRA